MKVTSQRSPIMIELGLEEAQILLVNIKQILDVSENLDEMRSSVYEVDGKPLVTLPTSLIAWRKCRDFHDSIEKAVKEAVS